MSDAPLHGVVVREREPIANVQGTIHHIVRADDTELYRGFGEAYASIIEPGVIKGWHQHEEQWSLLSCVAGEVALALHDPRADSPTQGRMMHVALAQPGVRRTVLIPPGIIYGWKNAGVGPAVLVNCATHPHGTTASRRIPLESDEVPFRWE